MNTEDGVPRWEIHSRKYQKCTKLEATLGIFQFPLKPKTLNLPYVVQCRQVQAAELPGGALRNEVSWYPTK